MTLGGLISVAEEVITASEASEFHNTTMAFPVRDCQVGGLTPDTLKPMIGGTTATVQKVTTTKVIGMEVVVLSKTTHETQTSQPMKVAIVTRVTDPNL